MKSAATQSTTVRGHATEQQAEHFLNTQGLRTITRNYRRKTGEIDLIMQEDATLVFVEVRLRTNRHCASGAESITPTKQRRLIRTAQWYLLECAGNDLPPCRFDVIAYNNPQQPAPLWIKNAFDAN